MTSNLSAGRELDALVAEKIMGIGNQHEVQQQPDGTFKPTGNIWFQCPYYSTDIVAAWLVVEHIIDSGRGVEIHATRSMINYFAVIADKYGFRWNAHAETAPLAICRAALKTVSKSGGA